MTITVFPSGFSTGITSTDRPLVEPPESIGKPSDAAATSLSAENSIFSLLKGCLHELGVPAGSGGGDTNDSARIYVDPLETLGSERDAAAASLSGSASAIALTKRILALAGL